MRSKVTVTWQNCFNSTVAHKAKYRENVMRNFAKKYLIGHVIYSCGKNSLPFITSGNINSQIYLEECLKKQLLPFILKNIWLEMRLLLCFGLTWLRAITRKSLKSCRLKVFITWPLLVFIQTCKVPIKIWDLTDFNESSHTSSPHKPSNGLL